VLLESMRMIGEVGKTPVEVIFEGEMKSKITAFKE
jgi:hypothetical protein